MAGTATPTGPLSPPFEDVTLINVNDSGTDVTFRGGVDLRTYDLRAYTLDSVVRGQALIDFDWNIETDNTVGTRIEFRSPGGLPPIWLPGKPTTLSPTSAPCSELPHGVISLAQIGCLGLAKNAILMSRDCAEASLTAPKPIPPAKALRITTEF